MKFISVCYPIIWVVVNCNQSNLQSITTLYIEEDATSISREITALKTDSVVGAYL